MPGLLGAVTFLGFFVVLLVPLGCDYIESGDVEGRILTPPSVREVIEDAEGLGLKPQDLLERRRRAALKDLEELYQDRMDDAPTDRAVRRLEPQLERAKARLDENYDLRKDRLQRRLDREAGG